jgi:sugar phosphate isomerase/epimerase
MMKIYIEMGNAAFADDDKQYEVARLIDKVAARFNDDPRADFRLLDMNGNHVGQAFGNAEAESVGTVDGPNVVISMDTGNAAFQDDNEGPEIARILSQLADRIRSTGDFDVTLSDYNGQVVGKIEEINIGEPSASARKKKTAPQSSNENDLPSP